MKKNLLIAGLFLALAAAYFGYNMYNKTHKNLNEINADFVITPQDLLAEFDTDEAAAQTKYLNKIIKLNGVLLYIQKVADKSIWLLSTGDPLSNIQCEMDPRYIADTQDKVKIGNTVTIQGICSGKLMDIILNQAVCIL